MPGNKPAKETVLNYGKPIIKQFINKFAQDLPREHKEEMEQEAYLRLLEAYDKIDSTLGWKAFAYTHCRGAVLDYLKFGRGTAEDKWSIRKEEAHTSVYRNKIRERVFFESSDGEEFEMDQLIGKLGIFSQQSQHEISINWDLVSRMASFDEAIHATAKWLRGFQVQEIADCFGVNRSKITQLISAFMQRFDDPSYAVDPWFIQTVYAFGLAGHLGMSKADHSIEQGFLIGWNLPAVDLDSSEKINILEAVQLELFPAGYSEKAIS